MDQKYYVAPRRCAILGPPFVARGLIQQDKFPVHLQLFQTSVVLRRPRSGRCDTEWSAAGRCLILCLLEEFGHDNRH